MENLAILRIMGIAVYLYYLWRKLREDYVDEKLIEFGWLSILFFLIGGRIGFGLIHWGEWLPMEFILFWTKPGFSYMAAVLSFWLTAIIYSKKNDLKTWMFMEDIFVVFCWLMIFVLGDEFIRSMGNIMIIIMMISLIFALWGGYIVEERYRSFGWYKSGKKGFVFFFGGFVFFTLLFGLSFISNEFGYRWLFLICGLIFGWGLGMLGDIWILNFPKTWWLQSKNIWKKREKD